MSHELRTPKAGRMDVSRAPFDVPRLIESCCASVAPLAKEGVELHADVAADVAGAMGDEAKVRQVIVNLLGNALKFTARGAVTLRATGERRDGVQTLVLTVSDSGIGIPPDKLDTIFEEFRQVDTANSEERGTGLGLAITRRLVQLMGGSIDAQSQVGAGSTFTVCLPVGPADGETDAADQT